MTSLLEKFVSKYGRLPTEVDPDYLEMLRMSKYRILAVPDVSPGKCANCGSSKNDGRKYVDFGLQVDWYGAVFLCGECLHDVSNAMGLFDALRAELVEAQEKKISADALQETGVELHDRVVKTFKELEEFYVGVSTHRLDSDSDSSPGLVDDSTESSEQRTDSAKPRVTKSTTSSRRSNPPSLANLLSNNGG